MVDRYYRKISNVENDIENAMQISSILLKLKGYDKKLEGLSKIGTNESNISSNSGQISTNTGAIAINSGQINNNSNNISSNLEKIDNFKKYMSESSINFVKNYAIEKQIFRFNKDKHFYTILEKEIEYKFNKNSLLFVKNNMYYKYDNLSNDYFRLQHEYNIFDEEDNLIQKYLFNKDTFYDENLDPILYTTEDFCIYFKRIIKKQNKIYDCIDIIDMELVILI